MTDTLRYGAAALFVLAGAGAHAQGDGVTAQCLATGADPEICACATVRMVEGVDANALALYSSFGTQLAAAQAQGAGELAATENSLSDAGEGVGLGREDVRAVVGDMRTAQTHAIALCEAEARGELVPSEGLGELPTEEEAEVPAEGETDAEAEAPADGG
ncbi:hypothetical protein HKCCE2091_15545 [Rhodobacterales bacterium HKCCE2091]|nr:hypothetical protein [Rhodobacterales bacterium HKCCE2091]